MNAFTPAAKKAAEDIQTKLAELETLLRSDLNHALTVAGNCNASEHMAHDSLLEALDMFSALKTKLTRTCGHVREVWK